MSKRLSMSPQEYEQKREQLFKDWQKAWTTHKPRLGGQGEEFVKDGAFLPEGYVSVSPRILFVLREPNDFRDANRANDWYGFDLCRATAEGIRKGDKRRPWWQMVRYAGECLGRRLTWSNQEEIQEFFGHLAILNLKKANGKETVEPEILNWYAHYDLLRIREESKLLDADIVILGGTIIEAAWALDLCVPKPGPEGKNWWFGDVATRRPLFISTYHPSAWAYQKDAVGQIRKAMEDAKAAGWAFPPQ